MNAKTVDQQLHTGHMNQAFTFFLIEPSVAQQETGGGGSEMASE